jgi:hypothetical protein
MRKSETRGKSEKLVFACFRLQPVIVQFVPDKIGGGNFPDFPGISRGYMGGDGDIFAAQYTNGRAIPKVFGRAMTFNRFRVRLSLTLPFLLIKGLIGHQKIQANRA